MTRKLLIAAALLIALVPFLGFSYSIQVSLTTTLSLFSAVTLFLSRKPRVRHSSVPAHPQPGESAPYMPQVQSSPFHEAEERKDNDSYPRSLPVHHDEPRSIETISGELPTHPISPRPRRRKLIASVASDEGQGSPLAHVVHAESHAEVPVMVAHAPISRTRRPKVSRSMIADEEPIRPADAVIPAHELAAEHAAFYSE